MRPPILVIDDEPIVATVLQDVLPEWTVEAALSGLAGLHALRAARAIQRLPDLVVLDVRLPDVDGRDLLLRIRTLCGSDLPVVPLTGLHDPDLESFATELGCAPLIPKGLAPDVLRARLLAAMTPTPAPLAPGRGVLAWATQKAHLAEHAAATTTPLHAMLWAATAYDQAALVALLAALPGITLRTADPHERALPGPGVDLLITDLTLAATGATAATAAGIPLLVLSPIPPPQPLGSDAGRSAPTAVVVVDGGDVAARIQTALAALRRGESYRDGGTDAGDRARLRAAAHALVPALTPRQLDVLLLHAAGWPTPAIAHALGVTPETVHRYWSRIYAALAIDRQHLPLLVRHLRAAIPALRHNDPPDVPPTV